jgi:hypothetical protein
MQKSMDSSNSVATLQEPESDQEKSKDVIKKNSKLFDVGINLRI